MGRVTKALQHSWNAFKDSPPDSVKYAPGMATSPRNARSPARYYNDRSFVGSIYTRMGIDCSSVELMHCRLDDNDVATEIIRDDLHNCITLNPNIDQSAQALKQDFAMTLFEQGVAALVPIDTDLDPLKSGSYGIKSMRVGRITNWYPRHVMVEVYDDREVDDEGEPVNGGIAKPVYMRKEDVCIVENPLYGIMNEPNGLLQRLITKLSLLDSIDEAAGSGKLDIIFQTPFGTRSDTRKKMAEARRDELSQQLQDDPLGIGWIDITEKVIQLNRPIDNKLLDQIEYLAKAVMTELGLTPEIMNGTASQDAINTYYDRTIEPIMNALALEMKRKFLTKTALTQRQSIEIYRDPLKLIPIGELGEVADKLIRNAVVTANELRPKIGYRPSTQPGADKLQNPNMPDSAQPGAMGVAGGDPNADPATGDGLDQVNTMLDDLLNTLDPNGSGAA